MLTEIKSITKNINGFYKLGRVVKQQTINNIHLFRPHKLRKLPLRVSQDLVVDLSDKWQHDYLYCTCFQMVVVAVAAAVTVVEIVIVALH